MNDFPLLPRIIRKSDAKILMLVLAGIGGPPDPMYGRSELDAARIPNMDHIAQQSAGGLSTPVAPGVSPGGAISNLALLGYDPMKHAFGRGALEALGAGMDLGPGDIAFRGNLAAVDESGTLLDRRAGRPSTEQAAPLIQRLSAIKVAGVEIQIHPGVDHRFALRLRGSGLNPAVTDTDPMEIGVAPSVSEAEVPAARKTAKTINEFVHKASSALDGDPQANAVLLRGAASPPELASLPDIYKLEPAAITAYPVYQGLARAVGMELYAVAPDFRSHLEALKEHWEEHDFLWVHYKEPDTAAADGDFNAKKHAIEKLDEHVRDVLDLKPDVFVIATDHASPSGMGGHSWHAVPFMIRSPSTLGGSGIDRFNEKDLRHGSLGHFEAKHAMMLIMAHAGKLRRFGA